MITTTGTMDSNYQNKNYNPNYQMNQMNNASSQGPENVQPINGKYSVYIANLHPDTSEEEIKSFFVLLTPPLGVKLLYDNEGMSRRCGFVYYATYEEAKKAIDTLNGQYTDKNSKFPLKLSFYEPNKNKNNMNQQRYNNNANNNMMMMNNNMNRQKMMPGINDVNSQVPMFNLQNPAQSIQLLSQVMPDPTAIMNLLSQAVQVNTPMQTQPYQTNMSGTGMNQGMTLPGNMMSQHATPIVDPSSSNMNMYNSNMQNSLYLRQNAMNQSPMAPQGSLDNLQRINPQYDVRCKVYVCPIDNTMDDEWLRDNFSSAGTIEAVKSMPDGYGFVTYSTPQMAILATQTLHNKFTNAKGELVSVTLKTAKNKNRGTFNNNPMNMQRNFNNNPMNQSMNQGNFRNNYMNQPHRAGPVRNNYHNNMNNAPNKKFTPY